MRIKLTAKRPRPASPDRAPVRPGSATARKPVKRTHSTDATQPGHPPSKPAPRQRAAATPCVNASYAQTPPKTASERAKPAERKRRHTSDPIAMHTPSTRTPAPAPAPAKKRAMPITTRTTRTTRTRVTPENTQPRTPPKPATVTMPANTDTPRLSKRLAELGLCSRREADVWIENGWVLVDGACVNILGARVRREQKIEVSANAHAAQARCVTILLHKPIGYVSGQPEDDHQPAMTLITPENHWSDDHSRLRLVPTHLRKLAPAGRLDIDSTGLIVFTQDGRIAKQLIGEHSGIEKEYLVRVTQGEQTRDIAQHFPEEKLALLRNGLSLDDIPLKPAKVSWQNGEQLRFVLREGKKRQIRRMCELVGLEVVGLKRVRIGQITLGALPPGQWRYLQPNELF